MYKQIYITTWIIPASISRHKKEINFALIKTSPSLSLFPTPLNFFNKRRTGKTLASIASIPNPFAISIVNFSEMKEKWKNYLARDIYPSRNNDRSSSSSYYKIRNNTLFPKRERERSSNLGTVVAHRENFRRREEDNKVVFFFFILFFSRYFRHHERGWRMMRASSL